MENLIISLVFVFISYLLLVPMKSHYANFRGANLILREVLGIVWLLCSIAFLIFLIILGVHTKWWFPIGYIALIFYIGDIISRIISCFIPDYIMSLVGIILAPILYIISLNLIF